MHRENGNWMFIKIVIVCSDICNKIRNTAGVEVFLLTGNGKSRLLGYWIRGWLKYAEKSSCRHSVKFIITKIRKHNFQ
jgi:hypothetical protein